MATTVTCSFIMVKGVLSSWISKVRIREDLTAADGTSSNGALAGESAYIVNGTSAAIAIAVGPTPDAATTTSTAASSAGFGLPAGASTIIPLEVGDKINVKTIA